METHQLAALRNWRTLNHVLTTLSEADLVAMLTHEMNGGRRMSMMERIHQRYNMVRCTRERLEIAACVERL